MVLVASAVFNILINLVNDELCLVELAVGCVKDNLVAVLACIGIQPFVRKPCCIVGNNGICSVKNVLHRAIIFCKLKLNNLYALAFIPFLKAHNIFYCSTAETVNALVVITYNTNIVPLARKQICKHILCI